MSASTTPTFRPRAARAAARLTVTLDLPTPPLPLATAYTRVLASGWANGITGSAAPGPHGFAGLRRALRREVGVDGGGVQPHAGGEVALAVSVDDHVREKGVVGETLLDVRRRYVLASGGDENVFLAIDDLQKPLVGEAAPVAGLEPPVGGERLSARRRVFMV